MGGIGSSRWVGYSKNSTIERCAGVVLDVDELRRQSVIQGGMTRSGFLRPARSGEIVFEATVLSPHQGTLRLTSQLLACDSREPGALTQWITLAATEPNFGGFRWLFLCPLSNRAGQCGRRVRKLYRPRGGRYFGCRYCHHLTYESRQTSDKRNADFLKEVKRLRRLERMLLAPRLSKGHMRELHGALASRNPAGNSLDRSRCPATSNC